MTRPLIGFAGLGRIGARRLQAILDAGTADVGAVFDVHEETANAAVQASGLRPDLRVRSLDELLDLDLDGVLISTPNRLHAEQTHAGLERGMSVFCQKPLGCDAEEVRGVLEAAHRADRLLQVDLTYRRSEALRAIRQRAEAGEIGDIYAVDLAFHNAYGPDKRWFYDRHLSGGGCFLDLGVHLVDMAQWVMGFPPVEDVSARFFAKGRAVRRDEPDVIEDHALVRIDFAGGATANVACSWHLSAGCNALIHATFHGTEGSLHMYNVDGQYFDLVAEKLVGTQKETLSVPNGKWDSGNAVDWTRRLGTSNRFDQEALKHVETARIMDRVYAA